MPGNVVQHLDSGGQAFTNLIHSGAGTLQLGAPLVVTGNLGNTDGNFAANDQPVQVGGVTTVNGNAYTAGAGTQAFAGGLVVDTNFSAAAGTVSAGGVTVGPDAVLVAPSSTLFDSGDWTNLGGIFDAHRGTVVLDGTHQHLSGSTLFNHLAKTAATTDTLTFQAGSTQTIAGNLILQGAAGSPLLLRSSATGTPWNVDPQGSRAVSFVDVEDSTNTAPTPIVAAGARLRRQHRLELCGQRSDLDRGHVDRLEHRRQLGPGLCAQDQRPRDRGRGGQRTDPRGHHRCRGTDDPARRQFDAGRP